MSTLQCVSPIDGSVCVTRDIANNADIDATLQRSIDAFQIWKNVPLQERISICTKAVDAFIEQKDVIAEAITKQMGRPIKYAASEVNGYEERARHMISIAEASLADVTLPDKKDFVRYIRKEPLGVVFTCAAWNYPLLIAVNSIIPAILAGNTCVLKHSSQTPLCAEHIADSFKSAGLPTGVFQVLHLSHASTDLVIKDSRIAFVAFTGSVPGGLAVQNSAKDRFIGVGLELGGKDPAYVRADAPLDSVVENLVDGAFFNSGQSCCGIERIYVAESLYDAFVSKYVDEVKKYVLGDPTDPKTTLGPCVRISAANWVRKQISEAVAAGATALIDPNLFPANKDDSPYLAPQVLVNVDHSMSVMKEESFGPVIGIMKVKDDDEAIRLMNDSDFGLTASIWSADSDTAMALGDRVDTGTLFVNRCDYLDPALAWVGVKDSGRGCTLSQFGFDHLTRPKSFHIRK